MKNINPILAVAVLGSSVLSLQSCKKYEDGPLLSLRSKTARLTGEWEITGGDNYSPYVDIWMEFEKDGDMTTKVNVFYPGYSYYGYDYTYTSSIKGWWEWIHNKEGLEISRHTGDGTYIYTFEWDITRLTNKEFNFTVNDSDWEFEKI